MFIAFCLAHIDYVAIMGQPVVSFYQCGCLPFCFCKKVVAGLASVSELVCFYMRECREEAREVLEGRLVFSLVHFHVCVTLCSCAGVYVGAALCGCL